MAYGEQQSRKKLYRKKIQSFLVKLSFTAIILYFVLTSVPFSDYQRALVLFSFQPLAAIFILVMILVMLLAFRWYLLAKAAGSKLSLSASFYGILMSFFFSQGLPASIGGDAFRLWWHRREGIATGTALNIIVFDRIYGLLSLVILCSCSVVALIHLLGGLNNMHSLVVVMIIAGFALSLLVMPWRLGLSDWLSRRSEKLPGVVAVFSQWVLKMRATLRKQAPSQTINFLCLGLMTHLVVVVQVFAIGHFLEPHQINFLMCLAAVPPALLITYMPFSIAGWGVREASMVVAFGLVGVQASSAIVISLMIGFAILVISIIGAFIWLIGGYKVAYANEVV